MSPRCCSRICRTAFRAHSCAAGVRPSRARGPRAQTHAAVSRRPEPLSMAAHSAPLAPEAVVLPEFAAAETDSLYAQLSELLAQSPWRHMLTPGGQRMSVAMTNCGRVGWISDRAGYRYQSIDPQSGRAWPQMPASWSRLAARAAALAGFPGFGPDACLINRYEPGARLSLHQDRNERDFSAPVVSVS